MPDPDMVKIPLPSLLAICINFAERQIEYAKFLRAKREQTPDDEILAALIQAVSDMHMAIKLLAVLEARRNGARPVEEEDDAGR